MRSAVPLPGVSTAGTCCAPLSATLNDSGAAFDAAAQAAMPAVHAANTTTRRESERFMARLLTIVLVPRGAVSSPEEQTGLAVVPDADGSCAGAAAGFSNQLWRK